MLSTELLIKFFYIYLHFKTIFNIKYIHFVRHDTYPSLLDFNDNFLEYSDHTRFSEFTTHKAKGVGCEIRILLGSYLGEFFPVTR